MTAHPIAVATPATDPVAALRVEYRRALAEYRKANAEAAERTRAARHALAHALHAAGKAGLSCRQISRDLGIGKNRVSILQRQVRPSLKPYQHDPTSKRARQAAALRAAQRKAKA